MHYELLEVNLSKSWGPPCLDLLGVFNSQTVPSESQQFIIYSLGFLPWHWVPRISLKGFISSKSWSSPPICLLIFWTAACSMTDLRGCWFCFVQLCTCWDGMTMPKLLTWRSQDWQSLVCYWSTGLHRVGHNWSGLAVAAVSSLHAGPETRNHSP